MPAAWKAVAAATELVRRSTVAPALSGSEREESGGGSGTPCLPAELFLQPGEHCLPLLVHLEVCWVHSMVGSYCHLWQNRRRGVDENEDPMQTWLQENV